VEHVAAHYEAHRELEFLEQLLTILVQMFHTQVMTTVGELGTQLGGENQGPRGLASRLDHRIRVSFTASSARNGVWQGFLAHR
jgi:hypothetical protein